MNRRLIARLALLAPLPLLVACPDDGGDTSDTAGGMCSAGLAGGELVITEIMADPAGKDDDGVEWFEVYNATGKPIALDGVGLVYSKPDSSDPEGHLIMDPTLEIPAGGYMTFGNTIPDAKPAYLDFGYGADLPAMSNTGGRLTIFCGEVVVDDAVYDDTMIDDGVSAIFDGALDPDPALNDDGTHWCRSPEDVEPFEGLEFGSPRAANAVCPLAQPETCGQCYEAELLRDVVPPAPGQLVISELMPNADLTDSSLGEWFELLVTDGTFDLNCLQYGSNTAKFAEDKTSAEVVLAPECLTVTAGEVLLFSELAWDKTAVETGLTLGDSPSATNPDPGVFIAYGDQVLDEVHYKSPKNGVAMSLDPQWATPAGNDDPAHFCAAYVPFAEGDLGTPGDPNPACLANPCTDMGGKVREAIPPAPGSIFVTEVHANASTDIGGEPGAEWLEFYATAAFDLNGLQLGKSGDSVSYTFDETACLSVPAGYVLLARDGELGKMLAPAATYTGLQLGNTDGSLWIGLGGVELDSMPYDSPKDGVAREVAPEIVDAFIQSGGVDLNDPPEARCDATQPYPPFNLDLGTPGAANSACDAPPPTGKCVDPDTMMERDIDRPAVGELVIAEFMANPKMAGDATAEWIELAACAEFDLNGLELGKIWDPYTVVETIPEPGPCLEVKPGDDVLLARSADPLLNGGLPEPRYVLKSLSLTNSASGLFVGALGADLDHTSYASTSEGKSTQLSLDKVTCDPSLNDDPAHWCLGTGPYNGVDLGTPAADNLMCGNAATCFDAVMMKDRPIVTPAPGDLVITEFLADPTIVPDTAGEWFEVRANKAVDLNPVKLLAEFAPTPDKVTGAKTLGELSGGPNCIAVPAAGFALIARNKDMALNGGLPTVDATMSIGLGNGSGAISMHAADLLLDAVQWASTKPPGKSQQLGPQITDPTLNDDADAPPWCVATNAGTPKQENPPCP